MFNVSFVIIIIVINIIIAWSATVLVMSSCFSSFLLPNHGLHIHQLNTFTCVDSVALKWHQYGGIQFYLVLFTMFQLLHFYKGDRTIYYREYLTCFHSFISSFFNALIASDTADPKQV